MQNAQLCFSGIQNWHATPSSWRATPIHFCGVCFKGHASFTRPALFCYFLPY
ncbi:hypothetical protein AHAS_Ahas11G0174500 [Arachis hypogaea]